MKLESVKKHEQLRQHKNSEAPQCVSAKPDCAPMQLAIQAMERNEAEQMKCLFNTVFYLVQAEHPFRDFPALLQTQALNGAQVGRAHNSFKQARNFLHFVH